VGSEKIGELNAVGKTNLVALSRIQKRTRPQVNQARPTLTVRIADRQAGDREMLVRIRTEIERKQADRVGHLLTHGLGHGRGCEIADRALNGPGFENRCT